MAVYPTVTAALTLGVVFAWAPLSSWYAFTYPTGNSAALFTVSAISITAWGSSLIAFSIQQRLAKDLSFGLRYVLLACFSSLIGTTGSSAVLRTVALIVFGRAAAFAFVSYRLQSRFKDGKLTVTAKLEDPPANASEAQRLTEKGQVAFQDVIDKILQGGPYWTLIALCAVVVFVMPSQDVVLWVALILLARGVALCFGGIIENFAPKFDEEFWKQYLESRRRPGSQTNAIPVDGASPEAKGEK